MMFYGETEESREKGVAFNIKVNLYLLTALTVHLSIAVCEIIKSHVFTTSMRL